jgi:hypothetical protein
MIVALLVFIFLIFIWPVGVSITVKLFKKYVLEDGEFQDDELAVPMFWIFWWAFIWYLPMKLVYDWAERLKL